MSKTRENILKYKSFLEYNDKITLVWVSFLQKLFNLLQDS